ncbi:hypothetical protein D3C76_1510540 [compost metagenome]
MADIIRQHHQLALADIRGDNSQPVRVQITENPDVLGCQQLAHPLLQGLSRIQPLFDKNTDRRTDPLNPVNPAFGEERSKRRSLNDFLQLLSGVAGCQ